MKKQNYLLLKTVLKRENKAENDNIRWAYFGYGIYSCEGENKVKDIPFDVLNSKCFKVENGYYCVDGALR